MHSKPTGSSEGDSWPGVSVVVPTRDRPELVERAVSSVLGQDYPGHVECIVVYDQSDPRSWPVPIDAHRSLRTVRNERTPGLAGARNAGLLAAAEELVGFCDDDDWWEPRKLTRQVEHLRANPRATLVSCGIVVHHPGGTARRLPPDGDVSQRDLLRNRLMEINPCTVLARRSDVQERIGLVDECIPGSYAEDYEWLLRATRLGPVVAVPEALAHIEWHRASHFAGQWRTMANALEYLLDKYPEFHTEPSGYARVAGQIAFARAAAGDRPESWRWSARALRESWRERRAYVAAVVTTGLIAPERVVAVAHLFGRGL